MDNISIENDITNKIHGIEITNSILNENNKYITLEYINNLLIKYGISKQIDNINLFIIATTHSSYLLKSIRSKYGLKIGDELDISCQKQGKI